jgi:hypothetical protein
MTIEEVGHAVIGAALKIDSIVGPGCYLRLGGFKLGFLLNFQVAHMRDGIVRMVNGL